MPVYDYSYKVYDGERRGAMWRWVAIPKFAYMEVIKLRIFSVALTVMAIHFLMRAVFIYLYVNVDFLRLMRIPPEILPPIDGWFFKQTIDMEFGLCFILAFTLGANLIARDLKHGALVLYVSKPINRWEYFVGKLSVLFIPFMLLLWVMPMLLFVMQASVAPANTPWRLYFWSQYAWIAGSITLYATVVSLTLSLLIMTASSLTKNARAAGFAFVAFLIGTNMIAPTMAEVLHKSNLLAISPSNCAVVLGSHIFVSPKEARALKIRDDLQRFTERIDEGRIIPPEESAEVKQKMRELIEEVHERLPLHRSMVAALGEAEQGNYRQATRVLSRTLSPPLEISRGWAWFGILGYWLVCGLILRRQINRGAQYGR